MIVCLPKPAKRSPKPRKPIPRVWAGGKRNRVPEVLRRYRDLEKQADALWSLIVRSRGKWCERCAQRPGHDPHHLISRSYHRTRWLIQCGVHLCRGCHMLVGRDSDENLRLAYKLIGHQGWEHLNMAKHLGPKADPAMAVVMLREEAKTRGLELGALNG